MFYYIKCQNEKQFHSLKKTFAAFIQVLWPIWS